MFELKRIKPLLLISPIIIFPLMFIIFYLVVSGILVNIIMQMLVGLYFFAIIPTYPFLFWNIDSKDERKSYFTSNIFIMFIVNMGIFILYSYFNRLCCDILSWELLIAFITILFVSSLFALLLKLLILPALNVKYSEGKLDLKKNIGLVMENISSMKVCPKNYLYFLLLLTLSGILLVVRFPSLFGDDPWIHTANTMLLIQNHNFSSANSYHGLFGLYSITAIFQTISGVDLLIITRWYPLLAIVIGGHIGFVFVKWLFNSDQIAIIGGILFIITPQDMCLALAQFWPTSLTVLIGTVNFIISLQLYKKNKLDYAIIPMFLITGIVMFFIHDFTAIVLIVGSFFVFIVQFLRNRGKNLQICILYGLVVLLAFSMRLLIGIGLVSDLFIIKMSFSPVIWAGLVAGAAVVLYFATKLMTKVKSENETQRKKKPTDIFYSKTAAYIVLGCGAILALIMIFVIPTSYRFSQINLPEMIINIFFMFTFITISVFGAVNIQSKNVRTDIQFFWIVFFLLIMIGLMALDFLIIHYYWWVRIAVISSGAVSFGTTTYLYSHLELGNLHKEFWRNAIVGYLMLLLLCHASYSCANQWYESDSEINSVLIYKDYIPENDNYIIGSFRWNYIFSYHANFSVQIEFFYGDLLLPENQIYPNGTNAIGLQKEVNDFKNTYLMLDQKQMSLGISGRTERYFGLLTEEHLEEYCNIIYLNKVASTQSSGNIFNYLYYYNQ